MTVLLSLPLNRVSDHEIQLQAWELVMSGQFGSAEHGRLQQEIARRVSHYDGQRH